MNETARTHVLLPRDLLDTLDRVVGKRRRSQFLAEAAAEKLDRLKRSAAAREAMGSLAECHIPEWDTPESAAAWVRSLRRAGDDRPARAGGQP